MIVRNRNPPTLAQITQWSMERTWYISQDPIKGSISVPDGHRRGNWLRPEVALSVSVLSLSLSASCFTLHPTEQRPLFAFLIISACPGSFGPCYIAVF